MLRLLCMCWYFEDDISTGTRRQDTTDKAGANSGANSGVRTQQCSVVRRHTVNSEMNTNAVGVIATKYAAACCY